MKPKMFLAFTGTRGSTTEAQYNALEIVTTQYRDAFDLIPMHGGCSGADREFHEILISLRLQADVFPSNEEQRLWALKARNVAVVNTIQAPLVRNLVMARRCRILLATPKEVEEQLRSGTWATIRYARKFKREIIKIWPDGTLKVDTIDDHVKKFERFGKNVNG